MQSEFPISKVYRSFFFLFLLWYWFISPESTNTPFGTKLFYSTALLMGFPVAWWLETVALLGLGSLTIIPTMSKVFFYSRRGASFFLVLCFCTLFWWSPYNETKSPFVIEMTIIAFTSFVLLWLQPPGVLFLANANELAGEALAITSNEKFPFRTVAMLKKNEITKGRKFNAPFSFLTDDCSVESEYEWRTLVDGIGRKVNLIIIDARVPSHSLDFEIENILHSRDGRIERTVCVSDRYGNAPALRRLTPGEIMRFNIIKIDELRHYLSGKSDQQTH